MSFIPDPYENAYMSIGMIYKRPGLIFDHRMLEHFCTWDASYPEKPERISSIYERIHQMGLIEKLTLLTPRRATPEEIETCHTADHRRKLEATGKTQDDKELEELSSNYDAIYINKDTYSLALLSAGSTIEMVDQICNGTIPSGFAIVRPPGHHAMESEYCGYCFFNNVALAVKHAITKSGFKRVLVIDWDVHHGQATQQMFYGDKRVLYFSIHRYEHGAFWPNLRESDYDAIGEGKGAGYNFNVPLNKTGMTNSDYLAIFHNLLLPVANEYQPDLVIVSAGYDAAFGCPEGEMKVTPACYAHLLWSLKGLARGKLAVVLEGGYCLESLAEGAALTIRALIGDPCPPLVDPLEEPHPEIVTTILDSIHAHRNFWYCFIQSDNNSIPTCAELEQAYVPSELTFDHDGVKPDTYATRDCYPVQSEAFLEDVSNELARLRMNTKLTYPTNKLCFVYHEEMMKHNPQRLRSVTQSRFPMEDPGRISAAFAVFMEHGLHNRSRRVQGTLANYEQLTSVHSPAYVDKMQMIAMGDCGYHLEAEALYNSVGFMEHTFEAARLAAGSVVAVVDEVMSGNSQSGIAFVRPPGHHATPDAALGFCYFNNVAIAAMHALERYNVERILILDWDIHHGNGTQQIFYGDKRVLYISLHLFKNGAFFPHMQDAGLGYTGFGEGEGFNVNIPWSTHGMGDGEYLTAFHSIIMPIAYEYNPELVLISAGFDACVGDPIGRCMVTPEAFGHMTHYVSAVANGRVILALEGGYNKESVAVSMSLCAKALLNDPLPELEPDYDQMVAAKMFRALINVQKKFWKCMRFDTRVPKDRLDCERVLSGESDED